MKKFNISPTQALEQIRESRPIVEPNEGFMQQLELYHRMLMTDDVEASPVYQRWMYQKEVRLSTECGQAPEAEKIRFEDEHVKADSSESPDVEYRCRKCRYVENPLVSAYQLCIAQWWLGRLGSPVTRVPLTRAMEQTSTGNIGVCNSS
jgi:hypothetical protein